MLKKGKVYSVAAGENERTRSAKITRGIDLHDGPQIVVLKCVNLPLLGVLKSVFH